MSTMPIINVKAVCDGMDDYAAKLFSAAFTDRGVKNKSEGWRRLRTSKPFNRIEESWQGYANYVWRILCFDLVGSGKHACMPVCADFEVWEGYERSAGPKPRYGCEGYDEWSKGCRDVRNTLDELIKSFEHRLPPGAMKGIIRWGRALGML